MRLLKRAEIEHLGKMARLDVFSCVENGHPARGLRIAVLRSSGGRRFHRGTDPGPGYGPCPTGDRVLHGHGLPPNTRQSTAVRHGADLPIGRPHNVAESSNPHAICSAFLPDTSTLLTTHNPGRAFRAQLEPREGGVVDQF
jgi:hypothetical protein